MDAIRLTPADVEGRPVRVTVESRAPAESRGDDRFDGTVIFAGYQEVETGGKVLVKAEVENRRRSNGHWILRRTA